MWKTNVVFKLEQLDKNTKREIHFYGLFRPIERPLNDSGLELTINSSAVGHLSAGLVRRPKEMEKRWRKSIKAQKRPVSSSFTSPGRGGGRAAL